jgi:phenylpropionate dioxygenase-like ring-hydroxylating dioxygenase large terminal subunit
MSDTTWTDGLIDEGAFRREQEKLGRVWTFLGLTTDLQRDNDWFCATLGGCSVFVQRFGEEIAGFENVCPHRFYPLRTADKGNGQVICGFHHWHYDRHGNVVGVPACREVFGVTPREIPARLRRVEIATCGTMVFGRFGDGGAAPGLEEFLGDGFPVLAAISSPPARLHSFDQIVDCNWRLMMNITLEEYHGDAVHRTGGYLTRADFKYWRLGMHSAFFKGEETLLEMAEDCRAGRYRPVQYRIFNIFPNLVVSLFPARPYWYSHIQQFAPISSQRSRWRCWYFPTRFPTPRETLLDRWTRPFTEPVRAHFVRRGIRKIGDEDHRVCERLQQAVRGGRPPPILGAQEIRVGWFQEAYVKATGG